MTRLGFTVLSLFAGSTLLLAQDPQTGGWRRFNDPPPAPAPQAQPAAPEAQDQDPSQPVARNDAYGQPQQPQQAQRPNDRPPAAVPHYGLPAALTIRPGTYVTVRVNQPISSDRNQQGDIFQASLAQPIVVDGVVVAQRGQTVLGRVAEAVKAGRVSGTSRLGLQLTGLTLADGTQANAQSQMVTRAGRTSVGSDVGVVGTTTALGAGVGAMADWGRGAAIGAGAGAVVGIAGVLLTRGRATVVYPETLLTFRIDAPVNVDLTRAPQAFRYVGPDEYDQPLRTTVVRRAAPAPYYTPYPYYSPGWGYPGYYGYNPYGWGPTFGIGIGMRGWGRRR